MKMQTTKLRTDEKGYIVVETVGTFIPFVLLVISILSLVNIVTLQARVHNALTQTANTLSMYSYAVYAAGMADELITLDKKASASKENINSAIDGINALSKGNGFNSETGGRLLGTAESAISDPKGAIESIFNYGAGEVKNAISSSLVRPLIGRYLADKDKTADEYLSSVRVKNFEFTECNIIDMNENIKLTVEYDVEYTFGIIRLPFGPTLKITQTAVTKAWFGGSGEGYLK